MRWTWDVVNTIFPFGMKWLKNEMNIVWTDWVPFWSYSDRKKSIRKNFQKFFEKFWNRLPSLFSSNFFEFFYIIVLLMAYSVILACVRAISKKPRLGWVSPFKTFSLLHEENCQVCGGRAMLVRERRGAPNIKIFESMVSPVPSMDLIKLVQRLFETYFTSFLSFNEV